MATQEKMTAAIIAFLLENGWEDEANFKDSKTDDPVLSRTDAGMKHVYRFKGTEFEKWVEYKVGWVHSYTRPLISFYERVQEFPANV